MPLYAPPTPCRHPRMLPRPCGGSLYAPHTSGCGCERGRRAQNGSKERLKGHVATEKVLTMLVERGSRQTLGQRVGNVQS
eukprot:3937273-Rhodomonas_salina.1